MVEMEHWYPDPAWDYAQVWGYLEEIKDRAEQTASEMSEQEDATTTSDAMLREQFQAMQMLCIRALDNLGAG